MNNDTNQITGIGLIKNYIHRDNKYNIYNDRNYNRFVYKSINRADRNRIDSEVVAVIEQVLFKGAQHFKRSIGITIFNHKLLGRKINTEFEKVQCDEEGYKCGHCGELKKGHSCNAIMFSQEQYDFVIRHLIELFII